jgi:hypothetical protein
MHRFGVNKIHTSGKSQPPLGSRVRQQGLGSRGSHVARPVETLLPNSYPPSNTRTRKKGNVHKARVNYHKVEKEAKRQHFIRTKEKLTSKETKPKDWWWAVKRLQGSTGQTSIPTLQNSSGTLSTSKEKADAFCELFANKCTIDSADEPAPPIENLTAATLDKMTFRPRDVRRMMKKLDPHKATGPDGIGNRVLRECANSLATPFAKLFRLSFERGLFPDAWKIARVVPIHKKKSRSNPENYRPISLLSNISKLMEYFVNRELRKHLFSHGLIQNNQFGFRPRHSAPDLLTYLSHEWLTSLNDRKDVKVVALDIKAAFDRVWHNGLIAKLKARGVRGRFLQWIGSYLNNRRIQVVVGGQTSVEKSINASVPQGSILGPTLFLIYIDDLGDNLRNAILLYADDSTLYCEVQKDALDHTVTSMNADLEQINQWGLLWKVIFAPEKCKVTTISKRRSQPAQTITSLNLGGKVLHESEELDILGVTFPSNMSFRSHLDKVASKAGKRVSVLRRIAPYLDTKGKATVYKAHIRSTMEYAPLSWMSASETQLRRLDDIQLRAQKIIGPGAVLDTLSHRRLISGLGLVHRMHKPDQPAKLRTMLPPKMCPVRSTRSKMCPVRSTRSSSGDHALQPLAGRSTAGQWSIQQYDRSALPTIVPVWNSLPPNIIGYPEAEDAKTFCKRAHHHLRKGR